MGALGEVLGLLVGVWRSVGAQKPLLLAWSTTISWATGWLALAIMVLVCSNMVLGYILPFWMVKPCLWSTGWDLYVYSRVPSNQPLFPSNHSWDHSNRVYGGFSTCRKKREVESRWCKRSIIVLIHWNSARFAHRSWLGRWCMVVTGQTDFH